MVLTGVSVLTSRLLWTPVVSPSLCSSPIGSLSETIQGFSLHYFPASSAHRLSFVYWVSPNAVTMSVLPAALPSCTRDIFFLLVFSVCVVPWGQSFAFEYLTKVEKLQFSNGLPNLFLVHGSEGKGRNRKAKVSGLKIVGICFSFVFTLRMSKWQTSRL